MTASKTTRKAVAKNTSKASTVSKAATKAPKKTTAKKTTAKKTSAKKPTVKKTPVKQEKEMTKALAIVEPAKTEPVKETPVETVKAESVKVEPVKEAPKAKAPKKKISKGDIRHILSPSRGGKVQQRLKGTATGKNQWGHKLGSQAAKIDHLIEAGRFSLTEIQTMSGARTKGRLYNHIRSLKEKGFPVINENQKMKFA